MNTNNAAALEAARNLCDTIDNECESVTSDKVWEAKEALWATLTKEAPYWVVWSAYYQRPVKVEPVDPLAGVTIHTVTVPLAAAPQPQDRPYDWPECSGDPMDCPENEGFGCCKPVATPARGAGEGDDPFGDMPAPIGNPEAWPPNYADGYNDAVRNMVDAFPSVRARFTATSAGTTGDDSEDAARYRWLRDWAAGSLAVRRLDALSPDCQQFTWMTGAQLDAAIDTARRAREVGK